MSLSLPEDFGELCLQFFAAKIARDDVAFGVEEQDVRNAIKLVGFDGYSLGVDDLRIGDAEFLDGGFGMSGLVGNGNAKDLQAFSFVLLVGGDEVGRFL